MVNTTPLSLSLDVSPLDFVRLMFRNTASDGTLVLSDWYDAEKDDAVLCKKYICKMNWTQNDLDNLIQEYTGLLDHLGTIALLLDPLDQQYQAELYTDSTLNNKILNNEQLEATYQMYVAPFSARWSLSQQSVCRVGEGPCAFELIFHTRRLCQLVNRRAPKLVRENEARMLIAAMAIHNYGGLNMKDILEEFIRCVLGQKIKNDFIYNEFSLQHELGIFLRERLGNSYHVKFERHIADVLKVEKAVVENTVKHEIDIVIEHKSSAERYGIELKFPKNGQHPEQMFSFIKDIRFCEEMIEHKFTQTFCLTVVNDAQFYSNLYEKHGAKTDIYKYFRNDGDETKEVIEGEIFKKTGKDADLNTPKFTMNGQYQINWFPIANADDKHRYYLLEVQ